MHEAHQPGDAPRLIRLDDCDVVDIVNRIREGDDLRVPDDLLRLFHAGPVRCRPVFDQLMLRAYPTGTRILLCSAPVAEQLDRLLLAILDELGNNHFTHDEGPHLAEMIAGLASDDVAEIFADIASDVVNVERRVFSAMSSRDDVCDAVRERMISPTSILVHLCEVFDVRVTGVFGELPNPVDIRWSRVMQMLNHLTDNDVANFLDQTSRTLAALAAVTDVQRYRAMIVHFQNGARRRAQRPGTGYLTVVELQQVFPRTRSLKVKISEVTGLVADLRASQPGEMRVSNRPEINPPRSRSWRAGADYIVRALSLDSQ